MYMYMSGLLAIRVLEINKYFLVDRHPSDKYFTESTFLINNTNNGCDAKATKNEFI